MFFVGHIQSALVQLNRILQVNPMLVITAVSAIGGLTVVLASLLVVANRVLYVQEDPRVGNVLRMLPGTNCGGCGYPGCQAFADALVAGLVSPAKCFEIC